MIKRLTGGDLVPGDRYWRKLHGEVYQETRTVLPLAMTQRPDGKLLDDQSPLMLDALITGLSGSAYSWTEAYHSAGSWVSLSGGRSGTANAYELNRRPDIPIGSAVRLRYSPADDYRFEWTTGTGGGTGHCDPPQYAGINASANCCPFPPGATATFYVDGVAVGSVDISGSSATGGAVPITAGVGAVVSVTVNASPWVTKSASSTLTAACQSPIFQIGYTIGEIIVDDILTLTDPAGNLITLTRTSLDLWEGSRNYPYGSGTITVGYQFGEVSNSGDFGPFGQIQCNTFAGGGSGPDSTPRPCGLRILWKGDCENSFDPSRTLRNSYAINSESRICSPVLYTYRFVYVSYGPVTSLFGALPHSYVVSL